MPARFAHIGLTSTRVGRNECKQVYSRYIWLSGILLLTSGTACSSPERNSTTSNSQVSSLTLETGVVMMSGDVKPVARQEFSLLKESAGRLLVSADGTGSPNSKTE